MKQIISTELAPKAIGPYSQAILNQNTLYTSGQIALDPQTGLMDNFSIGDETHRVMKNLKEILHQAGMDYSNIVKTTIYLINMEHFSFVNDIYAQYISEPYPARETIEVSRLPKDAKIEISIVACN